ncbi:MAG: adenosine deaminase [Acidobacteriales bacterium]|nr:adenosine deaminase [Terriglobales bacterium]
MQTLPKVELHLHLDCSLSYDVVRRLDPSVAPERFRREFVAPAGCNNLRDYIRCAQAGIRLMQSKTQLRAVVEDLFAQLAADHVIYAEIRFAPLLHTAGGLTPQQVLETVDDAAEAGIAATGVDARLILCTLRHFTVEQSLETAHLVRHFRGSRVAGFDLAADESLPLAPHIAAFRYAVENGLNRTAHAGEARGAESVWETLEQLKPARIGHGVRSVEDPKLVEHLAKHRIHLETCPTSNCQTGAVASYAAHPIDRLQRAGVSAGISCDGRAISDITLAREYDKLAENFAWGKPQLLQANLDAAQAAFLAGSPKARLIERLRAAYR